MRNYRTLFGALALATLAGCAALDRVSPAEAARGRAVDTGRVLASNKCLTCHQLEGASATGAPPTFKEVARRYKDTRLDWELETISAVGHYRMPRKPLSSTEIAALTAYIKSLDIDEPETPARRRSDSR